MTVLSSVLLNIFEKLFPMAHPLTDEIMLELCFAIILPALAAALLFFENASGGGTDHVTQETLRKQGCKGRFFLLCIFFYSRFLTVPDFEQVHEFDKKQ